MDRPDIVIVTPTLADANNGNWRTARRWAPMLSGAYRVRVAAAWDDGYFPPADAAALASLPQQLRDEPAKLVQLHRQCDALAALFDPAQETAALRALVGKPLGSPPAPHLSNREPP